MDYSRDSVVGRRALLRAGWCRVDIPSRVRESSLIQNVQSCSGLHTASYSMDLGGALSPIAHRPQHEADHSPPFGVEFKKHWKYTFTPPNAFMEGTLRAFLYF